MSKKEERRPSIRFKGYTEPWEQRKLGAYLTVSKNRNVDGEYDKSDVLSVSGDYGIVNQIEFQGRSFAGASVLPYGIVETGDVVYTKSPLKANPYGIIKTNHGKNGIVSTLYAVYKVNNGSNGIFVEYYFDDNLRLNKYLKPLVNKGAKNDMKVTDENVLKGDVIFPSLPEQVAIGSFFQDIDQLISLQQRKLEVLKEQKKTYLKLLFPAKGQIKPALRFAGFEDDWKEVKLGEVTDRYDNLRVPVSANERVSGDTPYYGANGIQDYVDGYTHDGEFILIAEDGASDLKDYPVQYVNGKVWVNNHAHVIQGKKDLINNIFLLFAVKQINIEPFLVGGGRAKLNSDIMMKLPLHLPPLPEQEAIGSFFQDLDKAIAKQEEKVNQLKESKQTLLRKMFI